MNNTMRMLSHVDEVHSGQTPLTQSYTGRGVLMGIIDSGLDLNHPDFQDSTNQTRVKYLWDMTLPHSNMFTPAQYGYGQAFTKTQIDAGLAAAHTGEDEFGHGSYVAGIAAGNAGNGRRRCWRLRIRGFHIDGMCRRRGAAQGLDAIGLEQFPHAFFLRESVHALGGRQIAKPAGFVHTERGHALRQAHRLQTMGDRKVAARPAGERFRPGRCRTQIRLEGPDLLVTDDQVITMLARTTRVNAHDAALGPLGEPLDIALEKDVFSTEICGTGAAQKRQTCCSEYLIICHA